MRRLGSGLCLDRPCSDGPALTCLPLVGIWHGIFDLVE
jgi:hypothetical protein